MTTKAERDELRRLDGERTAGPWHAAAIGSEDCHFGIAVVLNARGQHVASMGFDGTGETIEATTEFICAAANLSIPLADEVEGLRERVGVLEAHLSGFDVTEDGEVRDECGDPFPDDFIVNFGIRAAGVKAIHAILAATGQDDAAGTGRETP